MNGIPSDVMERMRKVLRMKKSTNPHEAANAAAILQRMLAKYQLSIADIHDERIGVGEGIIEDDIETGRRTRDNAVLALLLNVCGGIGVHCLGGTDDLGCVYFRLVGHRSDVEFARFLFDSLLELLSNEVSHRAQQRGFDAGETKAYRHGFLIGAAEMIRRRLEANQKTPEQPAYGALVVVKEKAVEQYVGEKYSCAKPRKMRKPKVDLEGYLEGATYARTVTLAPAVTHEPRP